MYQYQSMLSSKFVVLLLTRTLSRQLNPEIPDLSPGNQCDVFTSPHIALATMIHLQSLFSLAMVLVVRMVRVRVNEAGPSSSS